MSLKIFLKKSVVVAALFLCCCSPSFLMPTTADVSSASKRWAETDSASLHQGYQLYVNKCGACHALYRPSKFTEEKWIKEVPDMSVRAHITPAESEMILHYVLTRREVLLSQKK